jgi:pimeloyl-ACP methyl ester carboxylesterase
MAGPSKSTKDAKEQRVAVLLCPAQFCVPADYEILFNNLRKQERGNDSPSIGTCLVAPLPRTEWIKVARNLPSRAFLEAKLPVHSTLSWYFDAMETALAEIFASEGPDVNVAIIGHSIGGWVARAYLGGLSGSSSAVYRLTQRQCSSFVTLGTPHSSPDTALVDQTRGLLNEVEQALECSPESLMERGIEITCVGSSGLNGKFLSTNVEELVAASSYLPLLGRLGKGDGIVPLDLAFMSHPARKIEVDQCDISGAPVRHAHVVPTPWNLLDGSSPSIALPEEFVWYGSDGVIPRWAKYVR